MIQQPMYQELSETPEYQQQMMALCPVRVVYDTQMFLPPGEHAHQNQYVVNPQNPPPWIQNQVQNQLIYVQNVPSNYMQTYQQHVEPNQYHTYGYNVPQMLVQAPQDPRHLQMIPGNLVPNININQRPLAQNIGTMANPVMINEVQNQQIHMDKPTLTNEIINEIKLPHDISNEAINQMPIFQAEPKLPIQQVPVISNLQQRLPQYDQNNIQIRHVPQVVAPNMQQNYQTIVSQKGPPNIQQNYPSVVTHKLPPNVQSNFQSIMAQKIPSIRTNYQLVSGNGQPIYRTIQPRPTQYNNQPIQQLPSQNIVYMNSAKRNTSTNTVNTQTIIPSFVKLDSSRKRKCESPDEVNNKVVISNLNNVVIKQELTSKPVVEIIPNSTPVSRSEHKIIVNSLQITPIDTQNVKIKEELAKPVRNISLMEPKLMIRKKMINNVEAIQSLSNTIVQDKLIRNTVYTQARGRLLTDQQETGQNIVQPDEVRTENADNKVETNLTQSENIDSKLSEDKTEVIYTNNEDKKVIKDTKKKRKTKRVGNIPVKEEKGFILTHVLDGYVIQESNVAFPIRRPLRERTLRMSSEAMEPKTVPVEETKIEQNQERESERLTDITQLQLREDALMEALDSKDQDNPFTRVDRKSVKEWTVKQLTEHLNKYKWEETVSVLQDHEIDGESLYLVSKVQLLKIGISEEHATIIYDFVKGS